MEEKPERKMRQNNKGKEKDDIWSRKEKDKNTMIQEEKK